MSTLRLPIAVRHASRSLRRTPAFTLTAILTLVIGIGSSAAIFAVVNGVLLRPLPYPNADRLVGAWHDMAPLDMHHAQQTAGTYATYKKLAHSIEGIALYQEGAVNVAGAGGDGAPQRLRTASITATLLPVLQVSPRLGRNFTQAEDLPRGPAAVIISDALWRSRFGGARDVIGRTMDVNGRSRQIVGVMPSGFAFPDAETQLWLPLALDPNDPYPGGFNYNGIARLRPGVSASDAERDFAAALRRMPEVAPNVAPGVSTQLLLDQGKPQPLLVPLRADMTADVARTLWMIFAAAGLVLLVACFNVANLVLVRADGRHRELAVREALGAGRARLLWHFLGESALLAGSAALLGLGVAWLCVRALVAGGTAVQAVSIPRLADVRIDPATILFTIAVATVVAVICSLIPALRIGRAHLSDALREGGRTGTAGRARHRVRGALVAAQISLALVVLAGSALLLRTFQRLHAVQPGFDAEHVATFWLSLPGARYKDEQSVTRFYSRLVANVAQLPGVRAAGMTSHLPLEGHGTNWNPFYPEGDASFTSKIPPLEIYSAIDSGYFHVLGIPLIAGRNFSGLESQQPHEAIISQATAERFWHDPSGAAAIGKRFRELPNGSSWYTVIGVVGSVRDTALAAPPVQSVYVPEVPTPDTANGNFDHVTWTMAVVVRTAGDPAAMINPVQRVIRDMDPTLPTFDVRPMTAVTRASTARLSFVIVILGAAAVVTLLLGAIGLYGVMAYLVTLRTKELGVRIALGAQPRAVAAMMTRQGLVLTVFGIGGGLLLFALVARFLRSFLFGVGPGDPLALGAASVMLVAIAALASWIPARRASRVDPANTLRAE